MHHHSLASLVCLVQQRRELQQVFKRHVDVIHEFLEGEREAVDTS